MRILILTQLFHPEPNHLKGLRFAEELRLRGHDVDVLTGFPNYPEGKIYPGYRQRPWARETINGVRITRVPCFVSHSGSGFGRFLSYCSFAAAAAVLGVFLVRRRDLIHVYQGPATLMIPAVVLAFALRARIILDVQDLWPESVTGSGMLRPAWLGRPLASWSRLSYRLADRILVLSESYRDVLSARGVPPEKVDVVRNWSTETPASPAQDSRTPFPDSRFNVVFAGTMGRLQALDSVVDAAAIVEKREPSVLFWLIGGGVDAGRLKERVDASGLTNVRFLPRQPAERISGLLRGASALLIHVKREFLCEVGIPQKTQAYLALGRPIVMAAAGEAAALVREAGAGVICPPENPEALAEAVGRMARRPAAERCLMGERGRQYYIDKLAFDVGFEKVLASFARAASPASGRGEQR